MFEEGVSEVEHDQMRQASPGRREERRTRVITRARGGVVISVISPIPLPSACPKPARRSRKLSEFRVRAGDNDDLVFVTSDSISIFFVTIVSSDPHFPANLPWPALPFLVSRCTTPARWEGFAAES